MKHSLTFLGEQLVTLDAINGPYVWLIIKSYRIDETVSDDRLLSALVDDASFVTDLYVNDDSHGPYLKSALNSSDFVKSDQSEVESRFAQWMSNEGPSDHLDSAPIIATEIRPRLAGARLFLLADMGVPSEDWPERFWEPGGSDKKTLLSENADILGEWVEVVAIHREAKVLTTLAGGSD